MSEVSFRDWMKERQAHFESVAEAGIPGSDVFPQGPHEIRLVLRDAGGRGIEAAIRDAGHGQRIDAPHGLHDHAHVFDDLKIPAVHVQHVAVRPIHALIVGVPLRN